MCTIDRHTEVGWSLFAGDVVVNVEWFPVKLVVNLGGDITVLRLQRELHVQKVLRTTAGHRICLNVSVPAIEDAEDGSVIGCRHVNAKQTVIDESGIELANFVEHRNHMQIEHAQKDIREF